MSNTPIPYTPTPSHEIDDFLSSLDFSQDHWNNVMALPSSIPPPPPPPPLSRSIAVSVSIYDESDDEDDTPPLPPPAQSMNPNHRTTETALESYLFENCRYYIKKVNGEFCVYTLSDRYSGRADRYVGRAIRGSDGDGPLTDIDRSHPDPEPFEEDTVARILFPSS